MAYIRENPNPLFVPFRTRRYSDFPQTVKVVQGHQNWYERVKFKRDFHPLSVHSSVVCCPSLVIARTDERN